MKACRSSSPAFAGSSSCCAAARLSAARGASGPASASASRQSCRRSATSERSAFSHCASGSACCASAGDAPRLVPVALGLRLAQEAAQAEELRVLPRRQRLEGLVRPRLVALHPRRLGGEQQEVRLSPTSLRARVTSIRAASPRPAASATAQGERAVGIGAVAVRRRAAPPLRPGPHPAISRSTP
jgi:hypothetical protein